MKAGDIYIKTHIDNSGFDSDAKDLKNKMDDVATEAGDSAGNKLTKGITSGLGKIGTLGKKVFGGIGKIAVGIISAIGTVVTVLIGSIVRIGLMLGGALGGLFLSAGLIAGAFKRIGEENQELLANIKYIVFVISNAFYNAAAGLANMIAGAISKILNLLAKMIVYTAYIVKVWFGIDILANSSAEAFRKSQEGAEGTAGGLGKAAKNAKELKKQLAGFDEMNVLQDNDTSAGGGGAGGGLGGAGFTAPTIDLEGLQGEIPEWVKWIAENKDLVIAGLLGIAAAITAIYLGAGLLMSLGIGLIVAGIVLLIQDIVKFIQDPSWSTFADILRDLALILAGVAIVMIAINAANPVGWIILAIALVTALIALIIKNWDKIKATLAPIANWVKTNIIDPVANFFKGLWDTLVAIFSPIYTLVKGYIDFSIEQFKVMWGAIKNFVTTVWDNFKILIDNLMKILKPIFDFVYKTIIKPIADIIITKFNDFKNKFTLVINFIKNLLSPLVNFFTSIARGIGNAISGAFKGIINIALAAIEGILNSPIVAINALIGAVNKLPGVNLTKFKTFKFPRLAKGGIINQPGRGVMVGSAIAGERGAEGVIPLTDSQQMALLGEAIGRYITVNANITNTMNGRVISRELKQIQNENDFAFNR